MIPRRVHQLWIEPPHQEEPAGVPEENEVCIQSWKEHHPNIRHELFQLHELEDVLSDVGGLDIWAAVKLSRFPTMQSNLVRYALLWRYGGFWSDIRNHVQRPFLHEIRDEDLILVERPLVQPEENPMFITTAFMGCTPRHPFVFECMAVALSNIAKRMDGNLSAVSGVKMANGVMVRNLNQNRMPEHRRVSTETAWHDWMVRVPTTYNKGPNHWSKMQAGTSIYL